MVPRAFAGTAIAAIAIAIALPLGPSACGTPAQHMIIGQRFEAALACVDPPASIALSNGEPMAASCGPLCIVEPVGQNGNEQAIYITTDCGPFPGLDEVLTRDEADMVPGCMSAFAAYDAITTCGEAGDGGDEGGDDDAAPTGPKGS